MNNLGFILFFILSVIKKCQFDKLGWGYINIHCRDNDNSPIDWWYIYKPPTDVVPFFYLGLNFSYLTPYSPGRWEPSDKYITSNSMLQHTLAPIFRPTYVDYLALAMYDEHERDVNFEGSKSRGILMADEVGGVWIYHTVPGLINLNRDRPSFPDNEGSNGHLLMCLSLDLETVNEIFRNMRFVYPKLTYLKIPDRLQHLLPGWNTTNKLLTTSKLSTFKLKTSDESLLIEVLAKPPGNKRSLYKNFARNKNIVLDVYGQKDGKYLTSICRQRYSVRNIPSISLKSPDSVLYINNMTDRMKFAVSTAADWQKHGQGAPQYWTCISNLDKDDESGMGGDMLCVHNYKVWLAFDNFKVKEPEC